MHWYRTSLSWAAALLCLSVFHTGCDVVLGIPDVTFGERDAGPMADAAANDAIANPTDAADAGPPMDWWDTDYLYRTQVTVTPPVMQVSLVDVPVLLAFDATEVPFLADTPVDGIRIVDSNDNVVAHEVERCDPDGECYLWVRIPTMASETPVIMQLYYGNQDGGVQTDAEAVWRNNYLAVWHLQESVSDEQTVGVHNDSTGNEHHGAQNRNGPLVGDGAIGGAQVFDGLGDYIEVSAQDGLELGYAQMTITARVRMNFTADIDLQHIIGAGGSADAGRYRQLYWQRIAASWSARYRVQNVGFILSSGEGGYGVWSVLSSVYDGAQHRLFLDGQEIGTALNLTGDLDPITTFVIGHNPYLSAQDSERREFDGAIDEVRVSFSARSDDWLLVQYLSMNEQLVSYGPNFCQMTPCPP